MRDDSAILERRRRINALVGQIHGAIGSAPEEPYIDECIAALALVIQDMLHIWRFHTPQEEADDAD